MSFLQQCPIKNLSLIVLTSTNKLALNNMVSINYEPLEHLPYLEESITPEERSQVEQLIQIELSNQYGNRNLHPQVEAVLPIPELPLSNRLLDQKFEEDEDMEDDEEKDDQTGIDMARYQDTSNINNLYTTMSYSILQARNDELVTESQYTATYSQHLNQLLQLHHTTEASISNKRKALDDLNLTRKKLHLAQENLNSYLQDQWKDGLKSVVDLGVEIKRLEMDL